MLPVFKKLFLIRYCKSLVTLYSVFLIDSLTYCDPVNNNFTFKYLSLNVLKEIKQNKINVTWS